MKKRILAIIVCLAMVFTTYGYMGMSNPVVNVAVATEEVINNIEDAETVENLGQPLYERLLEETTVADMYTVMTEASEDEQNTLTKDEINAIFYRIDELDPQGVEAETEFLVNILVALPGFVSEAEAQGEDAAILAAGDVAAGTYTGAEFLAKASNGKIKLVGNVTVTSTIVVKTDTNITLDLNGFVLEGAAWDSIKSIGEFTADNIKNDISGETKGRLFVINNGGSLTINDSRPTNANKGSLVKVSRWVDKRLESAYSGYTSTSNNIFKDRYFWSTTEENRFWEYDGTGKTVISGGVITGGAHTSGGAILVKGGTLTINGGTFAGNRSLRYMKIGDNVVNGVTYEDVQMPTAGNGGAIYVQREGQVIMNGGSIRYNWTDALGGGICTIDKNSKFIMNSGDITENSAQGSGGGATVRGSTGTATYVGSSTFEVGPDLNNEYTKKSVPVIQGNRTYSTRYHGGGGGLEVDGGSLVYETGQIKNNYASGSGGGIYCYRGGSVNAKSPNSVISDNEASSGAGIYLQYGDVILEDVVLSNNHSRSTGGAVGIRVGNFKMTRGEIEGNTAVNDGGAAYIHSQNNLSPHGDIGSLGCSASLDGTTVINNTAGRNGGALFVNVSNSTQNVTVDLNDCTIKGNQAGTGGNIKNGGGGAVYLIGGSLTVSGPETVVCDNTADIGGAFYVEDRVGSTYSINEEEIERYNKEQGKNIHLDESGRYYNVDFTTNFLNENSTYKFVISNENVKKQGKVIINDGDIYNNRAVETNGGAVYVKGELEINGGTLRSNEAKDNGGAAYVDGGNVVMKDGTFDNNKAINGGAVYVKGGDFTMTSGQIINNTADNETLLFRKGIGGGVYAEGGSITIGVENCTGNPLGETPNHSINAYKDKKHPTIEGNVAYDSGGGLALIGNGDITMYCGAAVENEATNRGRGLNIYMEDGNFHLYQGDVGKTANPELVIVGGNLFDYGIDVSGNKKVILKYYHCNDADCSEKHGKGVMSASATETGTFNLPDGEKYWDAATGQRFFGWTFNGPEDQQVTVRKKSDYQELGKEIQALDVHDANSSDKTMHLYALWAPTNNDITYIDGISFEGITNEPSQYICTVAHNETVIPPVEKPGYRLTGWYIYQDEGQNANWGYEPDFNDETNRVYSELNLDRETSTMKFIPVDENGNITIDTGDTRFGNITLVANYEEELFDLTVVKEYPADSDYSTDSNQTFMFHVYGDPERDDLLDINMTIVLTGQSEQVLENLPAGEYTITEDTEWSWRFTPNGGNIKTLSVLEPQEDESCRAEFVNILTNSRWLNGTTKAINIYKKERGLF